MCDDSDTDSVSYVPGNRKRRARCIVDDSESSSESDSSIEKVHRRKRVFRVASDDESNTDSSDIISIKIHRNVRKMRSVSSDSNDSTESEDNSDWSSESEASDIEQNLQPGPSTVTTEHISTLSDSSDGESEKCPICLISFSKQEVGTPETCDHSFCAECIQEWSKNINTCPVDRQEFNLILVRRKLNGKVIRRIPVEKKQINDEDGVLEFDQTFCEVCGRSDREDRMLLCDGCDLGYHLECLTPPLDTVPVEEWYCSECSEEGFTAADVFEIYEGEVNDLLEEVEQMGYGTQLRRTRVNEQPRLLPRTRQSERVRARVETHRLERENINDQAQSVDVDQPSTSSGFESIVDAAAGPSTVSASKVKTKNLKRKTVKKNRSKPKKRRKTRYKTVEYEIDEESGAKFSVRKKITKRRRKRKNKRKIRVKRAIPKTVKKRLASQLGICPPQKVGQILPDVKIKSTSNGIESQRFHAGIPTLHLFGRRDELDYFDESNEEDEFSTAGGVTLASRSRQSLISHRHHRHLKAISLPSPPAASTACDILDSILHSQSKFHSKNSVMSIDYNGTVSLKDTNDNSVIKNSKPDLDTKSKGTGLESNSFDLEASERVTQTPMYPGYNGGGGNRAPYGFNRGNGAGYRGTGSYNSSYGSSGGNYTSGGFYGNGSRGRGANFGSHPFDSRENRAGYIDYLHRGPSPAHRGVPLFQRGRGAPRFPRRPFIGDHSGSSASTYSQDEDVHEIDLSMSVQENEISRSTEPETDVRDVSVNRDEDFDIYSDIEATPAFDEDGDSRNIDEPVSATPSLLPPPIPPALPGIVYGSDSDDGDSDVDLVIDDADKNEKYDPTKPSGDSDSEPDTTGATSVDCRDASSTDFSKDLIGPKLPDDMKTLLENNSDLAVAGTARPRIVLLSSPAPTEPENENCPNLSVYTSESGIESRERCATPDEDTDDECPNFSIYSAETLNIAKTTEQEIEAESSKPLTNPLKSDDLTISNDSAVPNNDLEGVPEPDSVQNDEVESSTGDFEQIDSQRKSPETTTVIDSAEPDSNNMEEESELAVVSQMSPKSKTARVVENSNQIEEISTTQNDIDAESKASRSDSTEIVQSSSVKNRIENILQKTLRLYDDSDLEEWSESNEKSEEEKVEKKLREDDQNSNRSSIRLESRNVMEEIEKLTEAVSEEERSYTPCMDENGEVEGSRREPGIGGLDTELVSDEEKNDFDESHEIRNASDGEALEINAKEHELDLAVRPDDYEEGEIVEGKKKRMDKNVENSILQTDTEKIERVETEVQTNKDIEERPKEKKKKPTDSSFKKVNKGGKDRNYRDRDREKSKSKERKGRDSKKKDARQRKEKRKELERYNVRNVVGQKIARKSFADIFGRDESRERSPSPFGRRSVSRERSSSRRRSVSRSRRSFSRGRRSVSRRRSSSRRRRSPSHRSLSRDRSISRSRRSSSRKRRSLSRNRRSTSRIRRSLSLSRNRRVRRSRSKSKSISPRRNRPAIRRSRSKTPRTKIKPRRRRSNSKPKTNKRIADDSNKSKKIKKKNRSISPKQREHIAGAPTRGSREPERVRYRREWSPSWSRSPSPRQRRPVTNISPSWTPPVRREGSPIEPQNLTVILTNDEAIKKKKEKRKKGEKRLKENVGDRRKRRRRDETPPPSKEVFASGDNILVSVSFNKTADESVSTQPVREMVTTKRKRDISDAEGTKRSRKDKSTRERNKKSDRKGKSKKNKDISNVKPVAIIDLDRSPFKEITPSPKDVIVLSDSDDPAKDVERHESPRDEPIEMGSRDEPSSTPQSPRENGYTNAPTGPKTPPEPQIKFHIQKPQQSLRNVSNPLRDDHDDGSEPEDDEDVDPRPELEIRTAEVVPHKGPNTPPEPPSSPPSSPDAYDPFEPTKSRSPTPEPVSRPTAPPTRDTVVGPDASPIGQIQMTEVIEKDESIFDNTTEASSPKHIGGTPDGSVGTPIRNISVEHERIQNTSTPELPRSTDTNNVNVIDQIAQPPAASIFPAVVKPIAATPAYSAVNPTIVCSTPITQNTTASRNNVFGGTPTWGAPTLVPQRVVHPTPSSKPSPAKPSPLKTSPSKGPIKSTPIKPMPSKTIISKLPLPTAKPYNPRSAKNKSNSSKSAGRQSGQNGSEVIDVDLDFDSPYSPGSSDYEDLFEPPTDTVKSNSTSRSNTNQKNSKSPAKGTFDSLFGGGSPVYRPQQSANKKTKQSSATKVPVKYNKKSVSKGAKNQVGIKLDEDSLKILDELPSSAVEMQVKDKFLKKLNRQERVVEEVKLVLKPHYNKKHVTKEQYKDILRRSVPKICHNKTGEINPKKIQALIEAYVKRARMTNRKGANNTSTNPSQTQTKPAKSTFWS